MIQIDFDEINRTKHLFRTSKRGKMMRKQLGLSMSGLLLVWYRVRLLFGFKPIQVTIRTNRKQVVSASYLIGLLGPEIRQHKTIQSAYKNFNFEHVNPKTHNQIKRVIRLTIRSN